MRVDAESKTKIYKLPEEDFEKMKEEVAAYLKQKPYDMSTAFGSRGPATLSESDWNQLDFARELKELRI